MKPMKSMKKLILACTLLASAGSQAAGIDGTYAYFEQENHHGLVKISENCGKIEVQSWSNEKLLARDIVCKDGVLSIKGKTATVNDAGNLDGPDFFAVRAQETEAFPISSGDIEIEGKLETHSFDRDCDAVTMAIQSGKRIQFWTTSELVCGYSDAQKKEPVAVYRNQRDDKICIAQILRGATSIKCF